MQCVWDYLHFHAGIPGCSGCDPPGPCLPKCASGRGEGSQDCRLWSVQRHRSVCVHSEHQAAHTVDGTRVNTRQTILREIRCVSVFITAFILFCRSLLCRYATICKYFHSASVMQMVIWCHNLGDLHVWYVRASLTPMILHATLVLVGNTVYIHS